jgi:hypothetical protein
VNNQGHKQTLQPRQPGNRNAVSHGFYATHRSLSPRGQETVEWLFANATHLIPTDRVVVEELAHILDLRDRMDERGYDGRRATSELEVRTKISLRVEKLTSRLALTPEARLSWAATGLGTATVEAALAEARRRREACDA